MANVNKTKVITGKNTRLSYFHGWEPVSINGGAEKYSVSVLIPKDDIETINASGIGKIGDKKVRCIDAENQVLFHLGYEHDENDMHDVKLLCERFDIPVPSEYK